MLKRLENRRPIMDRKLWINDRVRNLTYLQNITCFPDKSIVSQQREIQYLKKNVIPDDSKYIEMRKIFLEPMGKIKKNVIGGIKIPQIEETKSKMIMEEKASLQVI
jgi:hypothetical protein